MDADSFRRLGEASPALLAVFDDAGRFRWANASWNRILGWERAALDGRALRDLVHPDDRAAFDAALASAGSADAGATQRTRLTASGGGTRWVDWFIVAMSQGLCYARDVTETMKLEALQARQVRLMTLAEEVVGVGHWSLDVATEEVHWSPQVFRIYGYDPAGPMPDLALAINAYHDSDRARVHEMLAAAIARGESFSAELQLYRTDGELRHVLSKGVCEVDPATGRAVTVFGTFLDVTERDRMRDRQAREQRLVTTGMLAAGVGHEMNNPLTYICMNLDVVLEELHAIAEQSPALPLAGILASLNDAQHGATRLRKIVRGLRAFARDDAAPAPTELASVVDQSINMAMHEIRHRATCVVQLENVPLVQADDTRLSQVLVNLLCNAGQAFETFDPVHNRIEIGASLVGGDRVALTIADNGPGMRPEIIARIFEPFYTTKTVGEGTGLGLTISQSIIESFGGELACTSVAGEGTTFSITLNVATAATVTAPAVVMAPPRTPLPRTGHVIVVDDEPAVVRMLERVLSIDSQVTSFTDPREALEHLRSGPDVDVVFCDLTMPHITGMALFEEIQRVQPALAERFIFISGGAPREELRQFLGSVSNRRLDKPFDVAQLRELVRREITEHTSP